MAALMLGLALGASVWATPPGAASFGGAELLERLNAVRSLRHLQPLRADPALARVALAHAGDMARHGYLSHINPRGENALDRVRRAGLEGFRLLAENIASSTAGGDRMAVIIEQWLQSPSHRENLLNPAFNTTGVAVLQTSEGRTLVVELFATYERKNPGDVPAPDPGSG